MSEASADPSLAFVDTNIWLYAFSTSQDKLKSQQAKLFLRRMPLIALSTQVVNEVSVNLLRKFQADERDIRLDLILCIEMGVRGGRVPSGCRPRECLCSAVSARLRRPETAEQIAQSFVRNHIRR